LLFNFDKKSDALRRLNRGVDMMGKNKMIKFENLTIQIIFLIYLYKVTIYSFF